MNTDRPKFKSIEQHLSELLPYFAVGDITTVQAKIADLGPGVQRKILQRLQQGNRDQ
jgi:hypothetical protein